MVAIAVLFGTLGLLVAVVLVVLLRRGGKVTENADGLALELERRNQARADRATYNSAAMHNSLTGIKRQYHG